MGFHYMSCPSFGCTHGLRQCICFVAVFTSWFSIGVNNGDPVNTACIDEITREQKIFVTFIEEWCGSNIVSGTNNAITEFSIWRTLVVYCALLGASLPLPLPATILIDTLGISVCCRCSG